MTVDYDELIKNYWDALFNKLRNFTAGPAFLETWVHDEDHTRSILGLFEAADGAGEDLLTLKIGRETSQAINLSELETELSPLGSVEIQRPADELKITVKFSHEGK
jgi:hypothetical protein